MGQVAQPSKIYSRDIVSSRSVVFLATEFEFMVYQFFPSLACSTHSPLEQVDNLRKHVHGCGLAQKIELVITSPLLR